MARRGSNAAPREESRAERIARDAAEWETTRMNPRKIRWGRIDRASLPPADVAGMREAIDAGHEVVVPNVAYDGSDYWLIDGALTLGAALELRLKSIPVFVHMGDEEFAAKLAERYAWAETESAQDDRRADPAAPIPVEPPPSPSTFSDQLRAIIRRDGRTIYAIETAAGVPRGGVGRFLSGERGLTTDTLDRLVGVLGLRVTGPVGAGNARHSIDEAGSQAGKAGR
jgi:hypothetical protein